MGLIWLAGASQSLITPDPENGCDAHGDSRFQTSLSSARVASILVLVRKIRAEF